MSECVRIELILDYGVTTDGRAARFPTDASLLDLGYADLRREGRQMLSGDGLDFGVRRAMSSDVLQPVNTAAEGYPGAFSARAAGEHDQNADQQDQVEDGEQEEGDDVEHGGRGGEVHPRQLGGDAEASKRSDDDEVDAAPNEPRFLLPYAPDDEVRAEVGCRDGRDDGPEDREPVRFLVCRCRVSSGRADGRPHWPVDGTEILTAVLDQHERVLLPA